MDGVFPMLAAATFAGLVGILDDVFDLRFWMKAVRQAVVAFALLFSYCRPRSWLLRDPCGLSCCSLE